jgi:hypothetical protein
MKLQSIISTEVQANLWKDKQIANPQLWGKIETADEESEETLNKGGSMKGLISVFEEKGAKAAAEYLRFNMGGRDMVPEALAVLLQERIDEEEWLAEQKDIAHARNVTRLENEEIARRKSEVANGHGRTFYNADNSVKAIYSAPAPTEKARTIYHNIGMTGLVESHGTKKSWDVEIIRGREFLVCDHSILIEVSAESESNNASGVNLLKWLGAYKEASRLEKKTSSSYATVVYECAECGKRLAAEEIKLIVEHDNSWYSKKDLFDEDFLAECEEVEKSVSTGMVTRNAFYHASSNPEFYDTYGGKLPEVSRDHYSYEVGEVMDVHAVNGNGDSVIADGFNTPTEKGNFSKKETEMDYRLLNFWGYPSETVDKGYSSFAWSCVRYSHETAVSRIKKMMAASVDENAKEEDKVPLLTKKDLAIIKDIMKIVTVVCDKDGNPVLDKDGKKLELVDKLEALDWYIKTLLPYNITGYHWSKTGLWVETKKNKVWTQWRAWWIPRKWWIRKANRKIASLKRPEPTNPNNGKKWVKGYHTKAGTRVAGHWVNITTKKEVAMSLPVEKKPTIIERGWEVHVYQPRNGNWGFEMWKNSTNAILQQLIKRTDDVMIKLKAKAPVTSIVFHSDNENRRNAIIKARMDGYNIKLLNGADSRFVHVINSCK